MMRHVMIGLAAATLVGAMLVPDEGLARAGRGGGARVGAVGGRAHVSHPIARSGVGYGRYAGYGRYRGVGWGAAAVGAAAAGAAYYGGGSYGNGYYNNCYQDAYGQLICPDQYQYRYRY
jgi:hypothetical protein